METVDVHVQRTFVIPPPATPSEEVPFTVFDLVAPTYHVTVLFAFAPPNPTNRQILDGLAATLPRFPLLTAALVDDADGRRPCFVTGEGGAGALVVEAEVPYSALSDHLPLVPSPGLALLHPRLADGGERTRHMLLLQINRLACGGMVVASSAHHQAADGYSMATFFHAWTDAVRGEVVDRPVPYGPSALVPRRPPRCEFEHWGVELLPPSPQAAPNGDDGASRKPERAAVHVDPSEVTNLLLHYTSEFVARLKSSAQNKYTTFETVAAHVWRKIAAVRRLDGDTRTSVHVSVNGRGRLGTDAVPAGFFGNVVLTARSGTRAADLATGTLADAAALIRAGIRDVDKRYFQSFIDFGALHGDEDLEPAACVDHERVLTTFVEADSWLHLELHRLDFGCGGRLAGVLPAKVPQDGVVVLMPSLQKEGGVEVFVALWEEHARELETIAYTMEYELIEALNNKTDTD